MARIPRTTRSALTAQSAFRPEESNGWDVLANITGQVEQVVKPAAIQAARESGANAVYRDESGTLRVDTKSALGGELAQAHNATAFAAYLGQSRIDIRQNLTELRAKHQFDPAAFKEATDLYIGQLVKDAPPLLQTSIKTSAGQEATAMFDGLRSAQMSRDNTQADRSSKAARALAAQDLQSLIQNGASFDDPQVIAKLVEIRGISAFRANASFIGESEAEIQAFEQTVMGTAKALRFQREIEELGGAESISTEQRERLSAIVRDMDIDPGTREKMYQLLDGTLKTIDARSFVSGLTSDDYEAITIRRESGGRADAANPNSTASGLYQFLDGTYLQFAKDDRRQGGATFKGMTDDQILATKTDPAISRIVFQRFRAHNQDALTKAGLPINNRNEYTLHFFGEGDGVKVLQADPTAALSTVVTPGTIKANPHLKGMTVADALRWTGRQMQVKSSEITEINQQIDGIADVETREMARREASKWYQMQRQEEAEALQSYSLRIAEGDAVTVDEILNDPALDDGGQATLLRQINTISDENRKIVQTIADLNNPAFFFDPNDVKDRNRVDNAYKTAIANADPLSQEGQQAAAQILERTGFAPKSFVGAMIGATQSRDPGRIAEALTVAEQVERTYGGAFAPYGRKGEQLAKDAAEFRHELRLGRTADEAAAVMAERRLPENADKQRTREGQAKRFAQDLNSDDLLEFFDDQLPVLGLLQTDVTIAPEMQDQMMSLFREAGKREFIDLGDAEAAKARALASVRQVFGVSQIGGEPRLMRLPPENFYPAIGGSYEWLEDQLEGDVSEFVFGEFGMTEAPDAPARDMSTTIQAEDIRILSDDETQRDIAAGRPPSYGVMYHHKEKWERLPQRWFGDPAKAQVLHTGKMEQLEAGRVPRLQEIDQTQEETAPENSRLTHPRSIIGRRRFGARRDATER